LGLFSLKIYIFFFNKRETKRGRKNRIILIERRILFCLGILWKKKKISKKEGFERGVAGDGC
jgi:hypothetical protein